MLASSACYAFANFELDASLCQLRRAGHPVPIQPKAFKLLLHLVRHGERVVSSAELLQVVWHDERVTVGSVKRAVREARRALEDSGTHQSTIRSVRGFGYRFVVPISSARPEQAASAMPSQSSYQASSPAP